MNKQLRIKATLCYVHCDDTETWEMLEEVASATPDSSKFIAAVKTLYPGCETDKRYMRADLESLVAEQASTPMQSQDDVGKYLHGFRKVSTYLLSKKHLAKTEHDRLFLDGFPTDMQNHIQ
ncbi:hypothetical protein K503DRAFT_804843 [Rhizopogon vinicolor AM-OR11-026]|uniref:Retrotransposon gag domain-containing protein n=1 Tax=Rhizopogon vinicolor AM-OR11-026 TaxID=1314800 RepID=A0A1B7MJX5_9AGAM|nr:hypothetical protein K503DRAFT_804843 [Rhizopogon vinicolor AM-OR11-026]